MIELRQRFFSGGLTEPRLILLTSLFLALLGNASFFGKVLKTYPLTLATAPALLSLAVALVAVNVLLLAVTCFKATCKTGLTLILVLSALAAYFMDSYGIVINTEMLQNVAQTNPAEARDLLTLKLLAYLAVLGALPSFLLWRAGVARRSWRTELLARLKLAGAALLVLVAAGLAFGSFYASFLREHKSLRSFANPGYYLYSAVRFAAAETATPQPVIPHATDARRPAQDGHRELIILVVGETARADHFSLNGYPRETNPQLRRAGVISFANFWACGTSTAASLPCMFADATLDAAPGSHENILDVLQRVGTHVLWLDNNSDSKGVALRVPYKNYRSPDTNPVCDEECRDEGMLHGLQDYVDAHPQGDIFIVLHQMGNHGPAYYRRYPPEFEKFVPACRSNDLSQCSREEIVNAYDNAILYTDHFLAKIVEFLQHNSPRFEAGMFYISDHGESLGEGGVYLHGLPKALAPAAQLHVPALMWFSPNYDEIDLPALQGKLAQKFSHDNLFHTLLGLLEIESAAYRPELDILHGARRKR